jgi:hypothetical protein
MAAAGPPDAHRTARNNIRQKFPRLDFIKAATIGK